MNMMPSLQRAWLLFQTWRMLKRVCQICGVPLPSGESVCEEEACQMRALEGQAMLAAYVAEPSAAKRQATPTKCQTTLKPAPAFQVEPVFSSG